MSHALASMPQLQMREPAGDVAALRPDTPGRAACRSTPRAPDGGVGVGWVSRPLARADTPLEWMHSHIIDHRPSTINPSYFCDREYAQT